MHDIRRPRDEQRGARGWIIAALVVAAVIIFVCRGPAARFKHPSDYALVYGPARTWLVGGNPYDHAEIDRAWLKAGGPASLAPSQRSESGLLYPPTTLLMFAPFAALTWPAAHYAWIGANVAFLALILWSIARIAEPAFGLGLRRTWLFVAAALVFAPIHTTFHHGQTSLYVLCLGLLAFALAPSFRNGVLLGLASAIKPQIGLPMLALEGVRARWRLVVIGLVAIGVIACGSVLPMQLRHIPWWNAWRANLAAVQSGGALDPSVGNPTRHQMVHLQYPITALTGHVRFAQVLAVIIVGALAALFFFPPRKRMQSTPLLLSLSMVAVLSLMIVYHRFYDAVLLLVPLAWAIDAAARNRRDWIAWCVLILTLPFFLNSATALVSVANAGHLPAWLVQSPLWERLLLPHQGWALLAMAVCLLLAQRVEHTRQPAILTAQNPGL